MDKEQTRKAAEVMMGYAEGKEVQFRNCDVNHRWFDDTSPSWDWVCLEYRIKPKEPRTFYAVEYTASPNGIGPNHADRASAEHYCRENKGIRVIELVEVIR